MTVASAREIAERYARIRDEVGPGVTVVVATKYVSPNEMAALAEAGVDVVGENRAQDLERKHALYGDAFRWHFIGHLQSNKVKVVNGFCELVHSLGSDSAARRLTVPALLEVNLSGEGSKSGVDPRRDRRLRRAVSAHPGAHDDAAADRRRGSVAAVLSPPARARRRAWALRAQHGNVPGLPSRSGGGSDPRTGRRDDLRKRPGLEARSGAHGGPQFHIKPLDSPAVMGFSDLWNRTLVYFGIAEDDEWDDDGLQTNEEVEESRRPPRPPERPAPPERGRYGRVGVRGRAAARAASAPRDFAASRPRRLPRFTSSRREHSTTRSRSRIASRRRSP